MQEMIGDCRFTMGPKGNKIIFEMTTVGGDTKLINSVVEFTLSEAMYLRDCLGATIALTARRDTSYGTKPFTI